ncbi:MAG: bifunctional oligoribonuclease/PAP phosphatase NrnA [Deltaproteobacteria bacterium]|jgi:phosphoesterase RecJ-like protein|nr:bifunctional oligoribonuclease/PAP phosphatase NrnA [Deltaproteobacteria bacterium]
MSPVRPDVRDAPLAAPSVGATCPVDGVAYPEPAFLDRLSSAGKVLILGHHNPDGDALGASVGLGSALRDMGRDVTVGTSGAIAPNTRFILEGSCGFHLAFDSPEDVAGGGFDLLVFVDCHGPERVWPDLAPESYAGKLPPYLVIDHHVHAGPLSGCAGLYHDPGASSTGEMVARLIRAMDSRFTPPMLESLLAAIVSDTGFFTQANTTATALREAADLVELGGDLEGVNNKLNQSFSPARMRLLSLSLASMEFFRGGRVAAMCLTGDMLRTAGAAREDSEGFVDFPRSVKGVELAALFREDGRGRVKVSLRSRYPVSARQVAVRYGGGGHVLAAAYTDSGPTCSEAKARFLEGLSQILPGEEGEG